MIPVSASRNPVSLATSRNSGDDWDVQRRPLPERSGEEKSSRALSIEVDRLFEHLLLQELLQVDEQALVGLVRVVRVGVFRTLVQQPEQDRRIAFPDHRTEAFFPREAIVEHVRYRDQAWSRNMG